MPRPGGVALISDMLPTDSRVAGSALNLSNDRVEVTVYNYILE